MSNNFSISVEEQTVPLTIIGAEIIGRSTYVYHEAVVANKPESVTVDAQMFQNIIDDFINHIDIKRADGTQSHRQLKDSPPITFTF